MTGKQSPVMMFRDYYIHPVDGPVKKVSAMKPKDYPSQNWNKTVRELARLNRMPESIRSLPVSKTGYPVPWFASWVDGEPDFRIVHPMKVAFTLKNDLCWVCRRRLHRYKCFMIGPMCAITRTTAEPPVHMECGKFAAMVCPFMINPRMVRNEKDMPDTPESPGIAIPRNPGVIALWVTDKWYKREHDGPGILMEMGAPQRVLWYVGARQADPGEIVVSVLSGLPALFEVAKEDQDDSIDVLIETCKEAFANPIIFADCKLEANASALFAYYKQIDNDRHH